MASNETLICVDCGRHYYEQEPVDKAASPPPVPAEAPAAADPSAAPCESAAPPPPEPSVSASPDASVAQTAERVCKYCGSRLIRKQ